MGVLSMAQLAIMHPFQFRTLVQYYMYHQAKRDITATKEHPTSGWDRASMRRCWEFLDLTSRSFSAVIKELEGDLARTICLFYLLLRGLDTVEDDMTIPDDIKQPLLRSFHEKAVQHGWKFDGSGPNEKDRQLLVEYDVVVEEINRLEPHYKTVLLDICVKMETGMADFAHEAATSGTIYLETIEDYDLYCHYVAGLVGEGLSRIFAASGKERPWLGEQLRISNSMGLLLQKTNILRDYREDVEEKRFFWPKEIWGGKECGFSEMADMYALGDKDVEQRALWALSGMTVDALRHSVDSLDYLSLLKNQSVFTFCAIPATMALATLALCFMNPAVFQRNIKITKAEAASLIMNSTNPREVAYMFRDYARQIHAKADPADPYFLRISVACGKIERWCESHFPSFIILNNNNHTQEVNSMDARAEVVMRADKLDREAEIIRRAQSLVGEGREVDRTRLLGDDQGTAGFPFEMLWYMGGMMIFLAALSLGAVYGLLWFLQDPIEESMRDAAASSAAAAAAAVSGRVEL